MNKLIVCGGRDYHLTDRDREQLDYWRKEYDIREVVTGGCRGADYDATVWADSLPILKVTTFPAERYGPWPACGPIRNQAMADYCSPGDYCAVFPGGKGTANMCKAAIRRELIILIPESRK